MTILIMMMVILINVMMNLMKMLMVVMARAKLIDVNGDRGDKIMVIVLMMIVVSTLMVVKMPTEVMVRA